MRIEYFANTYHPDPRHRQHDEVFDYIEAHR